jgi:hypothetical protein
LFPPETATPATPHPNDRPISVGEQSKLLTAGMLDAPQADMPTDWFNVGLLIFVAGLAIVWMRPLWWFGKRSVPDSLVIQSDFLP